MPARGPLGMGSVCVILISYGRFVWWRMDGMRKGSLDKIVGHVWGVVKSVRFRLKISGSSDRG